MAASSSRSRPPRGFEEGEILAGPSPAPWCSGRRLAELVSYGPVQDVSSSLRRRLWRNDGGAPSIPGAREPWHDDHATLPIREEGPDGQRWLLRQLQRSTAWSLPQHARWLRPNAKESTRTIRTSLDRPVQGSREPQRSGCCQPRRPRQAEYPLFLRGCSRPRHRPSTASQAEADQSKQPDASVRFPKPGLAEITSVIEEGLASQDVNS